MQELSFELDFNQVREPNQRGFVLSGIPNKYWNGILKELYDPILRSYSTFLDWMTCCKILKGYKYNIKTSKS